MIRIRSDYEVIEFKEKSRKKIMFRVRRRIRLGVKVRIRFRVRSR